MWSVLEHAPQYQQVDLSSRYQFVSSSVIAITAIFLRSLRCLLSKSFAQCWTQILQTEVLRSPLSLDATRRKVAKYYSLTLYCFCCMNVVCTVSSSPSKFLSHKFRSRYASNDLDWHQTTSQLSKSSNCHSLSRWDILFHLYVLFVLYSNHFHSKY